MSLDFYLETGTDERPCPHCDGTGKTTECKTLYWLNITHNLGLMAAEAGVYKALWRPEEIGVKRAVELIGVLREGLARLEATPDVFLKLNPENGCGDYDGFVHFVRRALQACEDYPDAVVRISR